MHCDWLKKVTGHEAMCQGLRETACKCQWHERAKEGVCPFMAYGTF